MFGIKSPNRTDKQERQQGSRKVRAEAESNKHNQKQNDLKIQKERKRRESERISGILQPSDIED